MPTATLDERIRNWVRVMAQHRQRRHCAESLEGSYSSPQRKHWDSDAWVGTAPVTLPPLDHADAALVECCLCRCSQRARWVIRVHHIEAARPHLACHLVGRRIGQTLHPVAWGAYVSAARCELAQQLAQIDAGAALRPADESIYSARI